MGVRQIVEKVYDLSVDEAKHLAPIVLDQCAGDDDEGGIETVLLWAFTNGVENELLRRIERAIKE